MPNARKKIRILICNNYTLFREGIKSVIQNGGSIEVVGEADTAGEALEQLSRLRPDAVLMDVTTPDLSGFEATRRIKSIDPNVKVLILSLNEDEILTSLCMEAGADGHIQGDRSALYLQSAIHAACRPDERVGIGMARARKPAELSSAHAVGGRFQEEREESMVTS